MSTPSVSNQQKPAEGRARTARHRRRHGIQAGNEFRHQQRAHAVLFKRGFRPADTGVRLERDAAEEFQNPRAPPPAELEPDVVGNQAGRHAAEQHQKRIQLPAPRQRSAGEQQRNRGQRQRALLRQQPDKQQGIPVADDEFGSVTHLDQVYCRCRARHSDNMQSHVSQATDFPHSVCGRPVCPAPLRFAA